MSDLIIPLFAVRHGIAYGLASSIYNLAIGLAEIGTNVILPITSSDRISPDFLAIAKDYPAISFETHWPIPGGMPSRFLEETIFLNRKQRHEPIVFPNYFLPPDIRGQNADLFTIIHDCQHRSLPQYFSPQKRAWLDMQFSRTLQKAKRTILISEFERTQIAKHFGTKLADRCAVVPNAIDWSKYERGQASENIVALAREPFILSVAHQYPHKNTRKVIEAFAGAAPHLGDTNLVLVGRPSIEIRQLLDSGISRDLRRRISLTGLISDADLGHLYKRARLFVLASDYEGFGMPAVEAMGFGAPTLVTQATALPEVTLGSADYCPIDKDADFWSGRIRECLELRQTREALEDTAIEIRQRYTPVTIARRLIAAIESGLAIS